MCVTVKENGFLHWLGIKPRSTAWEAAMLTTIPPMPVRVIFLNQSIANPMKRLFCNLETVPFWMVQSLFELLESQRSHVGRYNTLSSCESRCEFTFIFTNYLQQFS